MINYLVFDVDNTLLDFGMSLYRTEKAVADRLKLPITEDYFIKDDEFIMTAWHENQMTQTADPEVQKDWHLNYRLYVVRHYEYLAERFGIELDPYELTTLYFNSIAEMHHTMEKETTDVYIGLSKRFKNVLATNSVIEVKSRLSIFAPYTYKIFVSDEVHAIKPSRQFYDAVLAGLGCDPSECLMIGDSTVDDMRGAKSAGFHTCWYRRGMGDKTCAEADYSIDSITQLPGLLNEIASN